MTWDEMIENLRKKQKDLVHDDSLTVEEALAMYDKYENTIRFYKQSKKKIGD